MDTKSGIREFLTSRRAKISPERAGLPVFGTGKRRVAGLRREEVALLAGISVEYYTRLERGVTSGVSEDVLDGIARALQLDEAERTHLTDLVGAANTLRHTRRRPSQERVRPTVQRILDAMHTAPAYVRNGRLDILAINRLGAALFADILAQAQQPPNLARFAFLNPNATRFWPDRDNIANDAVAILRAEAGRDPYDRRLTDLIGELSTRSDEFRRRWAAHDVTLHHSGVKRFHHRAVGDLTLAYEALELPGDPGQRINVYTAEPGTPSADALALLASWAATPDQVPTRDGANAG